MQIITESLVSGAKQARGLAVIIDVFRAFTTAAYVLNNGAKKIIPVGTLEEAFGLKRKNPNFILIGERQGVKIEGFDFGNSPTEIKEVDFTDKTVIQTTSSGTNGIINASKAKQIILGNFVCIQSIVDYIKKQRPKIITLVAMGSSGIKKSDEDELCARAIRDLLEGRIADYLFIKNHLRNYRSALKFFDKSKPEFPEDDFHLSLDFNKFQFLLMVKKEKGQLTIVKEYPGGSIFQV